MARRKTDILVATATFQTGSGEQVVEGVTRVRAGHPILRGREHLFAPLDVHYDVEEAVAPPARQRRTQLKSDDKD